MSDSDEVILTTLRLSSTNAGPTASTSIANRKPEHKLSSSAGKRKYALEKNKNEGAGRNRLVLLKKNNKEKGNCTDISTIHKL